jgi:oligopeptidase A
MHIASFFLDPYSRSATKRNGAWMNDCQSRHLEHHTRTLPVAHIVCNFTPPVGGKPSLLLFSEVETLFHEFGHGLQHMLTKVDYSEASGINNVEWDAVELPSQFMENWCYHKDTLLGLAQHYATHQVLPLSYYHKLLAAKHYRAASLLLRQIQFGLIDLELHDRWEPGLYKEGDTQGITSLIESVTRKTSLMPYHPQDRSICSFSHIFAGGYAAGYYSYLWAEVLSADAFGAFEEAGLEDLDAVAALGLRFKETVLSLGGSQAPGEVFQAFRGRAPNSSALLRQRGLAP